jgi:hypothetical protein
MSADKENNLDWAKIAALPALTIISKTDRQQAALWAKADLMLSGLRAQGGQAAT